MRGVRKPLRFLLLELGAQSSHPHYGRELAYFARGLVDGMVYDHYLNLKNRTLCSFLWRNPESTNVRDALRHSFPKRLAANANEVHSTTASSLFLFSLVPA